MVDQGFQILSRTGLDAQLATLFRRWDASPEERAEFVSWAWVVAASADSNARLDREVASKELHAVRESVHQLLADGLHTRSSVDLKLVSKYMFLDWLSEELQPARAA